MDMFMILFIITLIVLLLVLYRYHWAIQSMFNSSLVSFYTPDDQFPLSDFTSSKDYQQSVYNGFKHMKESTLVICGLLRDCGPRMYEIEKRAERVGNLFKDYRILIVENDSVDNTREYLLEWRKRNPKVTILGCGYNVKECKLQLPPTVNHYTDLKRILKMIYLRNLYIDELSKNYSNYDYAFVWDLDILGSVYLDGIANSMNYFEKNPSYDCIVAYGLKKLPNYTYYYDSYAHLDIGDSFDISTKRLHDFNKMFIDVRYDRGDPLVKVQSAFSGCCIYRIKSILDSKARYGTDEGVVCEHVYFNRFLKNVYLNPSMIYIVLLNV